MVQSVREDIGCKTAGEMTNKAVSFLNGLAICKSISSGGKALLILVPHQFSLFPVLVFPDFFSPFLDYAAHSVASSGCES